MNTYTVYRVPFGEVVKMLDECDEIAKGLYKGTIMRYYSSYAYFPVVIKEFDEKKKLIVGRSYLAAGEHSADIQTFGLWTVIEDQTHIVEGLLALSVWKAPVVVIEIVQEWCLVCPGTKKVSMYSAVVLDEDPAELTFFPIEWDPVQRELCRCSE